MYFAKKRSLKLVALLVMVIMGTAFKNEQVTAATSVSIDQAVRLAQAADIDYKIAVLTWENANIDDKTARAVGDLTPYDVLQQDLEFKKAERAFNTAHTDLVLGVIRDYVSLVDAGFEREISQLRLAVANIELNRLNEMIRIGNATEQDRLRELNRVAVAELNASSKARTHEILYNSFLLRLDLDGNDSITLDDRLQVVQMTRSAHEVLAAAREASFDVWERSINLKIAELDLESVKSQSPAPLALQKAQNNFRIQQLNAMKSETQFVAETTAQFHRIVDAWTELENAEREYLVALETYDQTLRQHDAGLKTDLDMKQSEIDRLVAKQTIEKTLSDYAISLLEFEVTLGNPLPYGERVAE